MTGYQTTQKPIVMAPDKGRELRPFSIVAIEPKQYLFKFLNP